MYTKPFDEDEFKKEAKQWLSDKKNLSEKRPFYRFLSVITLINFSRLADKELSSAWSYNMIKHSYAIYHMPLILADADTAYLATNANNASHRATDAAFYAAADNADGVYGTVTADAAAAYIAASAAASAAYGASSAAYATVTADADADADYSAAASTANAANAAASAAVYATATATADAAHATAAAAAAAAAATNYATDGKLINDLWPHFVLNNNTIEINTLSILKQRIVSGIEPLKAIGLDFLYTDLETLVNYYFADIEPKPDYWQKINRYTQNISSTEFTSPKALREALSFI